MGRRAAIFIQHGVEIRKQAAACIQFIDEQRWSMLHVVPSHAPEDAVRLVEAGTVQVVVTAYDSRAAQALAADIGDRGRVLFVHPEPTTIEPPKPLPPRSLVRLILRWVRRGRTVEEIAEDLEQDTGDIREVIRRTGRGLGQTD
jgi:hypothetical protein